MAAEGASAMATGQMSGVIRHLRRAVLLRDGGGLTDGQLLECFLARRDEAAFAALVMRHGPMVLGVCRRVLRNPHDAEDAFQATFLVLVRKAASVVPRELVGHWLYGVAYRTALKAKATAARRRAKERQVSDMPQAEAPAEDLWEDLQPLLDRELSRLPDAYQVPLVLCYLEGKSKKEVARQLGLPEGTVSSRLARARELLRRRLAGRGLALTAGALTAALSPVTASAAVPAPLMVSTVQAAALFAAGKAASAGVISAQVIVLTEGVLKAMLIAKLKIATAVLVAGGILGTGAGILTQHVLAGPSTKPGAEQAAADKAGSANAEPEQKKESTPQEKEPAPQQKKGGPAGILNAVDAAKNTITVTLAKKGGDTQEKTFEIGTGAEVVLDGKPSKLGDLKQGVHVNLQLSEDQKAVLIRAGGPSLRGELKAADTAKGTVVVAVAGTQGKEDKTFKLAKDVKLSLRAKKDATLADVEAGAAVALTLSADRSEVVALAVGQGKKDGQDPKEEEDQ